MKSGSALCGANDDGTFGLANVVNNGGMPIVQDPLTVGFSSMPLSAIRSIATVQVFDPVKFPLLWIVK